MKRKWKTLYRKRLEKLARHLERGKLEHKVFDFTVVNADRHRERKNEK